MRKLRGRHIAIAALLLVVPGVALSQGKPTISDVAAIEVSARPLRSFEKSGAERASYGALRWRGGLVLTSTSPAFGGWSGLTFEAQGNKLFAVSDAGAWMSAELAYADGRPQGLRHVRMGPIKALNGKPLVNNSDRDAEAVSFLGGTFANGSLLIGFERNDRIGRFPIKKGVLEKPSSYFNRPQEMRRLRVEGIEALAFMRGGPLSGAVIAISENAVAPGGRHFGWIWSAGEPMPFTVRNIDDFSVTDAASLSDGTLLILERRFRWSEGVKMRLRRIQPHELKPGALLVGEVLISADMNHEIDNMEGLAVRELPSGEVILTMISDDNFNSFLQRTVLLEFALPAPKKEPKPEGAAANAKPAAKAQ